jgi:Acyl-CoA carboxylase epsilon subunit
MARLRSISPDATPEEVAAIVAALAVLQAPVTEVEPTDDLHEWVRAARLRSRRAGLQRGPWRMSGRLARRARV